MNNIEDLNHNHYRGRVYTDIQLEHLQNWWEKIYDEFYSLRDNKSGKYSMNKNRELVTMSLKLDLLSDIENRTILLINMGDAKELNKFIAKRTNEVVADFKDLYPKVKLGMFSSLLEILTIVQSVLKSQINIFEEKLGAKENTIAKQRETIFDVVSIMSNYLGYNLDVNNMTCLEFIGHEKTIHGLSKNNKQK